MADNVRHLIRLLVGTAGAYFSDEELQQIEDIAHHELDRRRAAVRREKYRGKADNLLNQLLKLTRYSNTNIWLKDYSPKKLICKYHLVIQAKMVAPQTENKIAIKYACDKKSIFENSMQIFTARVKSKHLYVSSTCQTCRELANFKSAWKILNTQSS